MPKYKNLQESEEGRLSDTTTVAIKKFYRKLENEKSRPENPMTYEETHDLINQSWFPIEDTDDA